jgi:[acyl-carrier-protein] S-malonyltransferase
MNVFALTFAGQGSQSVGMMSGLAELPIIKSTFDEASTALGLDLWTLAQEGPSDAQNQTVNTQPLMLAAGVATWRAWQQRGGDALEARYFAGHSLGEYTALVASGVIAFADAVKLVKFRAEAMQAAVPEGVGGIAAIVGLDASDVHKVCADAANGEVLEAVNLNSPGQIVIAGHRSAVERGMALAKERGAKLVRMLAMSVPSHCSLLKPAAEKLADYLAQVNMSAPRTPVLQNADVAAFSNVDDIKRALAVQLYRPVRWIETVEAIAQSGATVVVECVPGKVLTGINKRIATSINCMAVNDVASMDAAIAAINAAS